MCEELVGGAGCFLDGFAYVICCGAGLRAWVISPHTPWPSAAPPSRCVQALLEAVPARWPSHRGQALCGNRGFLGCAGAVNGTHMAAFHGVRGRHGFAK